MYTIELADDPLHVLEEALRALKKKGALILGILERDSPWGKFYGQKSHYCHYYNNFKFFAPEEILDIFKRIPVEFDTVCQTLFPPPHDVETIEEPQPCFGRGGFVVLKATKKDT